MRLREEDMACVVLARRQDQLRALIGVLIAPNFGAPHVPRRIHLFTPMGDIILLIAVVVLLSKTVGAQEINVVKLSPCSPARFPIR